jgi:hypothetical protein
MTMATTPADDESYDDIFATGRQDRGEDQPKEIADPEQKAEPHRDEHGRFASKKQDEEVSQTPETVVDEPQPKTEPSNEADRQRHVPLSELMSERKRRQEIDQQLVEARARAQALEQLFQQQQRQPQTQPQPQEEVPDAFSDPQGYVSHVLSQERERQRNQMLNVYEEMVRARYGDEKVSAAFSAAQAAGIVPRLVQQTNPWATLMQWHQDHVVKQEVGSDLEAFKKKIADEAVQKAMAGLKSGSQAQQQQRFPGSLAAATATGEQGAVLTEKAAVNDIFGSDRRARRQA